MPKVPTWSLTLEPSNDIVHELAHLIEPNHTSRFWNIVRCQVPNLEKARAWLKEQGELLEQDL